MEDEQTSDLIIVKVESLAGLKCDVEACGATGVYLVKASSQAIQFYFSHIENYEHMNVNICSSCNEKADFFKKTKDSVLKGDNLLSMTSIPEFLKIPPAIIQLDANDDDYRKNSQALHATKRKHSSDIDELDHVIDKILRRINLPKQISDGADLVKDSMDKLEKEMNDLSDDIYSLYTKYKELVNPVVETRTTHETIIDADGTVTITRLPHFQRSTMESVPKNDEVQLIKEIVMLDNEPEPDDDEIEQVEVVEDKNDEKKLEYNEKHLRTIDPKVGWQVIAYVPHGDSENWVLTKVVEFNPNSKDLVVIYEDKHVEVPLTKAAFIVPWPCVIRPTVRVLVVLEEEILDDYEDLYYPGIIACDKLMKNYNSRYLVYLDNGNCRYVPHKNVRVMFNGGLDEFLKSRVNVFPETNGFVHYVVKNLKVAGDMVRMPKPRKFTKGTAPVLKDGKWKVAEIEFLKGNECKWDVVKVQFQHEVEWLFRGSPRFYQVLHGFNQIYPNCYDGDEKHKLNMLLDLYNNGLSSCVSLERFSQDTDGLKSASPQAIPIKRKV